MYQLVFIVTHEMFQQAKKEDLIISVRHAKILFCGASKAGKTSFCRLLRKKKHETAYNSTLAGNSQQILMSGKVDANWVDLTNELEIQELTKRLVQKLQYQRNNNQKDEPLLEKSTMMNSSIPSIDRKPPALPDSDVKLRDKELPNDTTLTSSEIITEKNMLACAT